jgi:4-aminobutyrate aminotransferase-like enzyme
VLVLTAGPFGNIIRMLPPLLIDEADLSRGLDVIVESVRASVGEAARA